MLRIIQNSSAGGAKSYYTTADYYSQGQEIAGAWRGEGAARLGLTGEVRKRDWDALCDNRHPATGYTLTSRQREPRRIGYDFNFHVPKSVSLLYGLTGDSRILDVFRASVDDTMRDMEAEMKTRVRRGGRNEDRTTSNMVWGEFIHLTSRPVDGIPDPHVHSHCLIFNMSFDSAERRWKAGQFADLKRDAPYFEALFHSRLAMGLSEAGLPIQRTRNGWEIAGIPTSALEKFSRRTALIEAEARARGVSDPEEKSEIGARTRERKQKDLPFDELRSLWSERLTDDESAEVARAARQLGSGATMLNQRAGASIAVDLALEHCFERKSVVPERQLQAEAIKNAAGAAPAGAVEAELRKRQLLVAERSGRRMVTMPGVLAEEERMIGFARSGRGSCPAFSNGTHNFKRSWLNTDQRKAVEHILGSRDRIIIVSGAAGVGKTTMMQEAVEAIEAGGSKVFTFAPSADASRGVLREEGFITADTVARLLVDQNLQQQLKGQVLWIDEAGLLGQRAMSRLFEIAEQMDARVILSGDRRQHGAVERGSPLRLLESEAGLVPAQIKEIVRQQGAYKAAVGDLSEGRTRDGFEKLDALGWVREIQWADRYKTMAADYVESTSKGKTALVVSPTHREGRRITEEIRSALRQQGMLGGKDHLFNILLNTNLTAGQRKDAASYARGDVLVFHQNVKGFNKGDRLVIRDVAPPLDQADRFQVFHQGVLPLAEGDVIRITHGGKTADKKHDLRNGSTYTIKGFKRGGDIELTNGWTVSRDFGHLAYGYVATSHASQGKTVDRVIVGQSAESFPASSREQFYVSVSRARGSCTVYTDDRASLLEAVNRSEERLTATDILKPQQRYRRHMTLSEFEHRHPLSPHKSRENQLRAQS
ncbi:MAG TPA: MobF family relaxase [Phycisphaerae bacterium]|nr:MobF family relaxase [Phycisphaerae bacterium]